MKPNSPITFSLFHLFWLVASLCVVLSLFQFSRSLGIVAALMAIAPPISHSVSPTRSAVISGLVAAIFWIFVILVVFFVAVFRVNLFASMDGKEAADAIAYWGLSLVVGASLLGGYLGGRTSGY